MKRRQANDWESWEAIDEQGRIWERFDQIAEEDRQGRFHLLPPGRPGLVFAGRAYDSGWDLAVELVFRAGVVVVGNIFGGAILFALLVAVSAVVWIVGGV